MANPIAAKARIILPHWPWIALIISAAMLGAAHYAERVAGLPPCILCLKQREAYWAAIAVSAAAIVSGYTPWRAWLQRLLLWALAAAFLYGLGMAVYHVGAEMKWWPGPKACAINRGGASAADIMAMLDGGAVNIVSCEDPTYWPIPGFITMAGWNALISLKLLIWSIAAALRKPQWPAPSRLAQA